MALIHKKPKTRGAFNPLLADPTRTTTLRRVFSQALRGRLKILAQRVNQVIISENALGIRPTQNFNPNHDELGRFTLYRGMSQEAYAKIKKSGNYVPERRNLHNDATLDLDTARHYASHKMHEDEGVVVKFKVHRSKVKRDELIPEDFKILEPISMEGHEVVHGVTTVNTRWMFNTTSEQVKAFSTWFLEQSQELLYGQEENSWWREYVQKAYEQGAGSTWAKWKSKSSFLQGAFNNPVQIERVKTLAGRVLTELKNVTQTMATQMSRSLVDGLAQGKSPRDVAKDLTATVSGLGENRAAAIAQTETIRAHAEGQLDSLENLGMDQVGVQVEWSTSGLGKTKVTGSKKSGFHGGFPSPCKQCAPMKGAVFTIQEARGLIPRHCNCRCSWTPAGVGEDTSGQKIGKRPINDALRQSIKAEIPAASKTTLAQQMSRTKWVGADRIGKISGKPPGEIADNFNPNHDKEGKFSSVPSSVMSDFNKMMDVAMVQAKPPEKPATMKIYEAMSHVESGADMGALVTMKDLRKHTQIPKEKFDKAVIDLFKSQMVMPHYHDFATSLAPHELAELVDSGTDQHANAGRYWVGIAKRRGTTNSLTENMPSRRVPAGSPRGGEFLSDTSSTKAEKAKAAHVYVGREIQRYSEEHNEPRFAKFFKGVSFPDNEPVDVAVPNKQGILAHGVELKTITNNSNAKITMDTYAQIRKVNWEKANSATFHTVVLDDSKVFNAKGPGQHDESKRVIYYRRGVAGSARIANMHAVSDMNHLKKLMETPEKDLPVEARRTDGKLRQGTWVAFHDNEGKGFRNRKLGKIVRAKK